MATTSALSGAKGRFLIQVDDTEDRDFIKLSRTIPGAGGGKRDALVPTSEDPEDIETICQTRIDFDDASHNDVLRLNTPALKFQFFRKCLRGVARTDWDNARQGKPNTNAGFDNSMTDFFGTYFLGTDHQDQKHWMENQVKPEDMSVTAFVSRIKLINRMMSFMPGANGIPYDDDPANAKPTLKGLLYQMMPTHWKTVFMDNDNDVNDANYDTARLIRFMKTREARDDIADSEKLNRPSPQRTKRGRNSNSRRGGHTRSTGGSTAVGKSYPDRKGPPGGRGNNQFKGKDYSAVKKGNFNCPWHGNSHKWIDCFGNPDSPKYRPTFNLVQRTQGSRDAHVIDDSEGESGPAKKKQKKQTKKAKKESKKSAKSTPEVHFAERRVLGGDSSSDESDY